MLKKEFSIKIFPLTLSTHFQIILNVIDTKILFYFIMVENV